MSEMESDGPGRIIERPDGQAALTAATITDTQIRALGNECRADTRMAKVITCALGLSRGGATAQRRARARCAEILNARASSMGCTPPEAA